jgi:predicted acetyltransferase
MWRFLCEMDWVVSIAAEVRPVDDPIGWFVEDARTVRETDRVDLAWLRLLSTDALAARRYRTPGQLTIAVSDRMEFLPAGLRLEVGDSGVASCEASTSSPDISIDAGLLASLAMGGASALQLASTGLLQEHTPGAADLAERMFRWPVAPWCFTQF